MTFPRIRIRFGHGLSSRRFAVALLVVTTMVTGTWLFGVMMSKAATFGWVQGDWSGGADPGAIADHNSDRTGWTGYESADAGIDTAGVPGDVRLAYESHDLIQTSDTDFAAGTFSDTRSEGTGDAADISLDLQEVSVPGQGWRTESNPKPASLIGNGFDIVEAGGYRYLFRGGYSYDFYRTPTVGGTWTNMASTPKSVFQGAKLFYPGSGDYLYALFGWDNYFGRYSISGNSWTMLANFPSSARPGAIVYPGSGDFLYATTGNNSSGFYRYSISGNVWAAMASAPGAISGSGLAYPGSGDHLYLAQGGSSGFYRYSISGNAWETMAVSPRSIRGALVSPGSGDYLYAPYYASGFSGMLRYSISGNSWTVTGASYPGEFSILSAIVSDTDTIRFFTNHLEFTYAVLGNSFGAPRSFFNQPGGEASGRIVAMGDSLYGANRLGMDFYRYSTTDGSWTFLAQLPKPFGVDDGAIAASADSVYVAPGNGSTDLFRYDAPTDSWYSETFLPTAPAKGTVLYYPGIGEYLYYLRGGYARDFYRYSLPGKSWEKLPNALGNVEKGAALAYPGEGDFLYLVRGSGSPDFSRYPIAGGSWTSLTPVPVAIGDGGGLVRSADTDTLYVARGANTLDAYRYSVSSGGWTRDVDTASEMKYGGGFAYHDGTIYAFPASDFFCSYDTASGNAAPEIWERVGSSYGNYEMDAAVSPGTGEYIYTHAKGTANFYRYSVADGSWEQRASSPAAISASTAGFMTAGDDGFIYAFQGSSNAFYRYSIPDDSWTTMTPFPESVSNGGALAYSGSGDYLYALQGNSVRTYRYSLSGNAWERLADMRDSGTPMSLVAIGQELYANMGVVYFHRYSIDSGTWEGVNSPPIFMRGGSLMYPGSGNFLYAYTGAQAMARYSVSERYWTVLTSSPTERGIGALVYSGSGRVLLFGNSVSQYFPERDLQGGYVPKASFPGSVKDGSGIVYPGSGDYLYATAGYGSASLYRYSRSGDSWTAVATMPGSLGSGGTLTYPGSGDYLYVTRGGNTADFYRYSILGNTWQIMAPLPDKLNGGASAVFAGSEYLYCTRGDGTVDFYRYSVSEGSWARLASGESGGVLAYPGSGDSLYLYAGSIRTYSLSRNEWVDVTEIMPSMKSDASAASSSGEMYIADRDGYRSLYRFSAEGGWKAMAPIPGTASAGVGIAVASDDELYVLQGDGSDAFYGFSPRGYRPSGTYVSPVRDLGLRSDMDSVSIGTAPAGQTVSVDVRAGDTAVPDEAWTDWITDASGSGDPSVILAKRYLQYRVNLATADSGFTPRLLDATLSFSNYQTDQELVSSVYDTTDAANLVNDLHWTETLPSSTDIVFQLRSSADNVVWSDWQGPDGTPSTVFGSATGGNTIPTGLGSVGSNRYLQYKAILTTDGSETPILSDITVVYVVNAPPDISEIAVTQEGPSDIVIVDYSIRDPDTDSGSYTPNFVTPAFQYSADGGATWHDIGEEYYEFESAPLLGEVTDTNTDGKTDNRVLPGASLTYSIRWNAQRQLGVDTNVDEFLIRVTVNDNELANNSVSKVADPTPIDTRAVSAVSAFQSDAVGESLGKVVVSYEYALQDDIRSATEVSLQYLSSSGWAEATTVSGDVGTGIASGTRQIVWDARTDDPERYEATDAVVRVVATYASTAQSSESDGYLLDTRKPVIEGVSVDLQRDFLTVNEPTEDSDYGIFITVGSVFPDAPQFPAGQELSYPYTFAYSDLSLITESGTISVRVVDRYGNASDPFSHIAPIQPQKLTFFDISDEESEIFSELLTWRPMVASDLESVICRAAVSDGTPVPDSSSLTYDTCWTKSLADNFRIDDGLDGSTHYYYRVHTRNTLTGSVSNFSNIVDDTPNGNGSSDSTPPSIYDLSLNEDDDVTATSIRLTWKTDEPSNSGIGYTPAEYYDEDGYARETVNYASEMILSGEEHSYTLTGLDPDALYYLRIRSDDVLGNQGISANWSDEDGGGLIAIRTKDGPAIQKFTIKETSNTSVTIGWITTALANSYIYYSRTIEDGNLVIDDPDVPNDENGVIMSEDEYVLEHELTVPNLVAGEKYYFAIKSVGTNGNYTVEDNAGRFYEFTTDSDFTSPEVLFDAGTQPFFRTESQAGFRWITDEPSRTIFRYRKSSDTEGDYKDYVFDPALFNRNHLAYIEGLEAYTDYDFVISAIDINGNIGDDVEGVFRTRLSPAEDHPPLVSIGPFSVPADSLSDTYAVANFETDQPAICIAELTVSQGSYTNPIIVEEDGYSMDQGYCTKHSMKFIGLIFSTSYYYTVTCHDNLKDGDGNFDYVSSDEHSFTTREKLYTATEVAAAADAAAADATVTAIAGATAAIAAAADITAPSISGVKVSGVSGEAVTITWSTDEKASSNVHFGSTGPEENLAGDSLVNASADAYVTDHSVTVNGLVPATEYRFKISSADASGNIGLSSESSFTTSSPSSISSIKAVSSNLGEAVISWDTSKETTSVVEYGMSTVYDQKKESSSLTKEHEVRLSGLELGVTYHFRVKGRDGKGVFYSSSDNAFQPKSPPTITETEVVDVTEKEATIRFRTNIPTDGNITYTDVKGVEDPGYQGRPDFVASHEIILKGLVPGTEYSTRITVRDEQGTESSVDGPGFTTSADTVPPTVDKVQVDSALTQSDKVQTIISWVTDEPATSQIVYSERGNEEERTFGSSDGHSTTHTVVITAFKSGAVYEFRIRSVDLAGNETVSKDFALLTPKQTQNIIQVIVGNFQDIFGWAKM